MSTEIVAAIVGAVVGFILGVIAKTMFSTPKERFDMRARSTDMTLSLRELLDEHYKRLVNNITSIQKALGSKQDKSLVIGMIAELRMSADLFFGAYENIAMCVRRGDIDSESYMNDHASSFWDVATDTLPTYHDILKKIHRKYKLPLAEKLDQHTMRNLRFVIKANVSNESYALLLEKWGIDDVVDKA